MAGGALPIRNGAFVAVVGPSGAGKDTLIAHARRALARRAACRIRPARHHEACDGATEDHDTLTDAAFERSAWRGRFRALLGGAWIELRAAGGASTRLVERACGGRQRVARRDFGASPALRQCRRGRDHRRARDPGGAPCRRAAAKRTAMCWPGLPARSRGSLRDRRRRHRQQRPRGSRRQRSRRHHPQGRSPLPMFRAPSEAEPASRIQLT